MRDTIREYKFGAPNPTFAMNTPMIGGMMTRLTRQEQFRLGMIPAGGGKPNQQLTNFVRTLRTVEAANFEVSSTTAGDTAAFHLGNWGTATTPTTNVAFGIQGTAANHPSQHQRVINGGYDISLMLSCQYRFDVRWVGTDAASKQWCFAYCFTSDATAIQSWGAGTVTIDNFKDIRHSTGWVYRRFSSTSSGGSIYPAAGIIKINIPDVPRLMLLLQGGDTADQDLDWRDCAADIGTGHIVPAALAFLHIAVFTTDGVAFSAGDVTVELTVNSTVRIFRERGQAEAIEEATQVA